MSFRKEIMVQTQFVALHQWADAPIEVAWLRHPHRHVFYVKIGIPVDHNDRDREFFIEQERLKKIVQKWEGKGEAFSMSCEMFAEDILKATPYATWCEVWEDGENGARLQRNEG